MNPLVETRAWLHRWPWLWDGLIFMGHHAAELMAGALVWIFLVLVMKTRRTGLATGAQPSHDPGLPSDTTQGETPPPRKV